VATIFSIKNSEFLSSIAFKILNRNSWSVIDPLLYFMANKYQPTSRLSVWDGPSQN
jgi:hypothetical protein